MITQFRKLGAIALLICGIVSAVRAESPGEAESSSVKNDSGGGAAGPVSGRSESPIASTDGERPGVSAQLLEFKRTGNTLTLKALISNDSDKDLLFGPEFGEGIAQDHGTVAGIHLLDTENKKKYFVVRDSNKMCACSTGLKDMKPKSKINVWAKFPAPPGDVKKLTIEIPHFMPMDDVPIG